MDIVVITNKEEQRDKQEVSAETFWWIKGRTKQMSELSDPGLK